MAMLFIKHKEKCIFILILKTDFGVHLTLYFERGRVVLPYAKLTPEIKSNRGEPG
jgi:hypothetical protein